MEKETETGKPTRFPRSVFPPLSPTPIKSLHIYMETPLEFVDTCAPHATRDTRHSQHTAHSQHAAHISQQQRKQYVWQHGTQKHSSGSRQQLSHTAQGTVRRETARDQSCRMQTAVLASSFAARLSHCNSQSPSAYNNALMFFRLHSPPLSKVDFLMAHRVSCMLQVMSSQSYKKAFIAATICCIYL